MRSSGIFHNEKKGLGTIFASSARGGSVVWIGMRVDWNGGEHNSDAERAGQQAAPPRQHSP
jgi:hypothetical protein